MATVHDATDVSRHATCPACGHHVAVALFAVENEPLDVARCVECGHVFNAASDRAPVTAAERPSRSFSSAPGWQAHVCAVRDEMLARLPASPTVVEIGHGDGQFLTGLAEARPSGRYIGFDPHGAGETGHAAVTLRRERFVATRALPELSPDLILSRYVLEYLADPLSLVQELVFAAATSGIQPLLYLEVPCIDRALETGRTFDFDREHISYFTRGSFMRMLSRCSPVEQRIGHGYQREALYAFVRLGRGQTQVEHARTAETFRRQAGESITHLRRQLDALAASGRSIAIWGGTGASATFISYVGADDRRFPIVVDSDAEAVGTVVAGTGQRILSHEWLREHPVDLVIIPAQRRACDIVREMRACDIQCDRVLVEDRGRLTDYVPEPREGSSREAFDTVSALASR